MKEANFRIDLNPDYAKKRPRTKGTLWLWSKESGLSVSRSLFLLKYLLENEHNPERVLIFKEAIRMIEAKKTGEVIVE